MVRFRVRAMTGGDVGEIARWRYAPPYDIYDGDGGGRGEVTNVPTGYVAVTDEVGELVGFYCFGNEARVPGCERAGCYADDALDLGLGLRPDLVGRGLGGGFVQAGLDYAVERFVPKVLRMTVAAFNQRAIRVYERAGFVRGERCHSSVRGVHTEFVVMRRSLRPGEKE